MRRHGCPEAWARVRSTGVARVLDGWEPGEVAEWLGVDPSTVSKWLARFSRGGWAALAPAAVAGRPPKLTAREAARVLAWVRDRSPADFGFDTDRWTARRLAAVVDERLGVRMNHRYLNDWLARRGISPQLPQRVPRERDDAAVARWVARDWPAIKRGRGRRARPSCSPTSPGS